jgi:hypothetical protein
MNFDGVMDQITQVADSLQLASTSNWFANWFAVGLQLVCNWFAFGLQLVCIKGGVPCACMQTNFPCGVEFAVLKAAHQTGRREGQS